MTDGKKKSVVSGLHENVSSFFDAFFKKHSTQMKCGLGCSRCCVGNLSVFPVEAQVIQDWYFSLPQQRKLELRALWLSQRADSAALASSNSCVFLAENSCTIYDVRPAVCRTQGLPLKVPSFDNPDQSGRENFELSLCELNFTDENKIPGPSEWLDLERLNTLLVIAQKHEGMAVVSDGIKQITGPETGRVQLADLRDLLLQLKS
ncbi:MAG: YkgJ family cysteine cluster protein [Silvanigrellaceae bacterium]